MTPTCHLVAEVLGMDIRVVAAFEAFEDLGGAGQLQALTYLSHRLLDAVQLVLKESNAPGCVVVLLVETVVAADVRNEAPAAVGAGHGHGEGVGAGPGAEDPREPRGQWFDGGVASIDDGGGV